MEDPPGQTHYFNVDILPSLHSESVKLGPGGWSNCRDYCRCPGRSGADPSGCWLFCIQEVSRVQG